MKGRIHSTESFGTVDGPGIRYVVFLQGCPMRCLYCHNPDTWRMDGGYELEASQIIADYAKNSSFYQKGGLTVTGGEPLLQIDFLLELFALAKERQIHTCIDTSGITYHPDNTEYLQKLDRLMDLTDLVMLDIKQADPEKHLALTGHGNQRILEFARYLESKKIPLWVRHVVVKGYTDSPEDLKQLGHLIGQLSNLHALDVLPYHTMGVGKYRELGIKYPLEGVEALSHQEAAKAKQIILDAVNEIRKK